MTSQESSVKTRKTWNLFAKFTNNELDELLKEAGVVPCKERSLKLQQALTVWYHGSIPNINEIGKLAEEFDCKSKNNFDYFIKEESALNYLKQKGGKLIKLQPNEGLWVLEWTQQ